MSRWSESRFRVAGRIKLSTGHLPERLSEARAREQMEMKAMASVNLVILMGHLGADPDLKYTESGKAFCSISLATSDEWTDKDGVKQKKTEWHRIKIWGKPAENCKKYLQKGSSVYIEGRISTSRWKDSDQKEHFATEILADKVNFLSSPSAKPAKIHYETDDPAFRHRSL